MITQINKHLAMTLAEVLITLLIIGIVAALTIPIVIQDAQNEQFKASWKNIYSVLSDATTRIRTDNGGQMNGAVDWWDHRALIKLYLPYLNVQKDCTMGAIAGGCWHQDGQWLSYNTDYTCSAGGCFHAPGGNAFPGAILSDGTLILVQKSFEPCTDTDTQYGGGRIDVDVNGFKPPNTWGKDIFSLIIQNSKVVPYYYPNGLLNDNYNSRNYLQNK